MLYFAYGSNMSYPRLLQRLPQAKRIASAVLFKHQLRMHMKGSDGSAKANVHFTDNNSDKVYGVLYELDLKQFNYLDQFESIGIGYERKTVTVQTERLSVDAETYVALYIDKSLCAYHWYREHFLFGAIESGFPQSYLDMLAGLPFVIDTNEDRAAKELSVYKRD